MATDVDYNYLFSDFAEAIGQEPRQQQHLLPHRAVSTRHVINRTIKRHSTQETDLITLSDSDESNSSDHVKPKPKQERVSESRILKSEHQESVTSPTDGTKQTQSVPTNPLPDHDYFKHPISPKPNEPWTVEFSKGTNIKATSDPDAFYTEDGYKVFIPKGSLRMKTTSGLAPCRGCDRYFKKSVQNVMEPSFYVHCITECIGYKNLGLTKKCDDCKCIFVTDSSFTSHSPYCTPTMTHPSPSWMSKDVYRTTFSGPPPPNTSRINCPGCQSSFDCIRSDEDDDDDEVLKYAIDYFIHCITYCEEYKKLNLIVTCKNCKCLFLDTDSLNCHKSKCSKRKKRPIKRYYDFK